MAGVTASPRHDVVVHRWIDHTGELELELQAATERGIFEDAAAALGETESPTVVHEVSASAPERAALLAEWLSELAYLAEADGFVPTGIPRLVLGRDTLEASVVGRRAWPPHLVKGVTYHRLGMWKASGTWRARAILDV